MVDATDKSDREIALEERRLKLDESFPKKWGSVIFGSLATIIVAAISATVTVYQYQSVEKLKILEQTTLRTAEINAQKQRDIANSRVAIELYFNHFDRFSSNSERSIHKLALVAEVSGLDKVKNLFYQMRDEIIFQRKRDNSEITIADASVGLPSITSDNSSNNSSYTVYIHYPDARKCLEYAELTSSYLSSTGMRVAPMERIQIGSSPNNNQIRYYGTLQKVRLATIQSSLQGEIGISFDDQILPGNLPDGIFEVWIGEHTCAT